MMSELRVLKYDVKKAISKALQDSPSCPLLNDFSVLIFSSISPFQYGVSKINHSRISSQSNMMIVTDTAQYSS